MQLPGVRDLGAGPVPDAGSRTVHPRGAPRKVRRAQLPGRSGHRAELHRPLPGDDQGGRADGLRDVPLPGRPVGGPGPSVAAVHHAGGVVHVRRGPRDARRLPVPEHPGRASLAPRAVGRRARPLVRGAEPEGQPQPRRASRRHPLRQRRPVPPACGRRPPTCGDRSPATSHHSGLAQGRPDHLRVPDGGCARSRATLGARSPLHPRGRHHEDRRPHDRPTLAGADSCLYDAPRGGRAARRALPLQGARPRVRLRQLPLRRLPRAPLPRERVEAAHRGARRRDRLARPARRSSVLPAAQPPGHRDRAGLGPDQPGHALDGSPADDRAVRRGRAAPSAAGPLKHRPGRRSPHLVAGDRLHHRQSTVLRSQPRAICGWRSISTSTG